MYYHDIPDWSRLRERYMIFWGNDCDYDGVIAHIQNPNPYAEQTLPESWMNEASDCKYLDPERLYAFKKWRRTFWNWHGDLFEYVTPSYGANTFTGFCGGKVVFGKTTVWHEPVINSVEEFGKLHFDQDNFFWRALLESIDYAKAHFQGVLHVGMPDFGGPADWISSFMGAENFFVACAERPAEVRNFALRLTHECNQAFDLCRERISSFNDGYVNWLPVWHYNIMTSLEDDTAINLSPAMYADIFMPAVRLMAEHAPVSVLHWHDGSSQHIDNLLKEKDLDLIQFGHDPNTGAFRDFVGHMRRIQAVGKKLFISCVEAEDVEFFIRELDPGGLMMIVNTSNDDDSKRMRDKIRRWTSERIKVLTAANCL